MVFIEEQAIKLYPTNDFIFKRIYGRKGCEDITESLIKSYTGLEVKIDEIQEQKTLDKDIINEKAGILDIYTTTKSGEQITIEMQVGNYEFLETRLLKYNSETFIKSSVKEKKYDKMRRTISIMIVREELPRFNNIPESILKWNLREEKYHDLILTDKMEIYIIMLEKIKKEIELGNLPEDSKKALWTKFLIAPETLKEVDMKNNKDLEKANEIYEETLQDEEEWRQALRREMFLCDIVSAREEGLEKGYEQGLELGKEEGKKQGIQEGMQEGIQEGIQKGIRKGIQKGEKCEKIKIAKKMLLKSISIDEIMEITELTLEEIKKIKNEN